MVQYLYSLGENYVFLKRFREALQMFQKIYTLNFNHYDPHFQTSLLRQIANMQRLGDHRISHQALQDAIEIQKAYLMRLKAMLKEGEEGDNTTKE
jgi:tetratricopeptide (TPR) repeat protein